MSFYGQQVAPQNIQWPTEDGGKKTLLWTQVKVGDQPYLLTGSNSLGFVGDESIGLEAISNEAGANNSIDKIKFKLQDGAIQTKKLKQQNVYNATSEEQWLYDILQDVLSQNVDLSDYKYITVTATTGEGKQMQFKRQCIFVYTPNQTYPDSYFPWSLLADIRAPEYNSANETLTLY